MGNFEYKNTRAESYKRLKKAFASEPDHEERQKILDEEKSTPEFQKAEEFHKQEKSDIKNLDFTKEKGSGHFNFKTICNNSFLNGYVDKILDHSEKDYIGAVSLAFKKDTWEKLTNFLEKCLNNSVLIDLGCGGLGSVQTAYGFAAALGVRKYKGVERYPRNSRDEYSFMIDEFIKNNTEAKEITEKGHKFPPYELTFNVDMIDFLGKITEQSNIMLCGMDNAILKPHENLNNYLDKLQEQIARIVPKNGIVFGTGSVYLGKLAELGFVERKDLELFPTDQIWEKKI